MSKRILREVPWVMIIGFAIAIILVVALVRPAKTDGPAVTADSFASTNRAFPQEHTVGRGVQHATICVRGGDTVYYRVHLAGRDANVPLAINLWGAPSSLGQWRSVLDEQKERWTLENTREEYGITVFTTWNFVFLDELNGHAELEFSFVFPPSIPDYLVLDASVPGWNDRVVIRNQRNPVYPCSLS